MRFIDQKQKDPIAVIDEHEVHDMLCVGVQLLLDACPIDTDDPDTVAIVTDYGDGAGGCIDTIRIVPKNPEEFTPALINKWEGLLSALFGQIRLLDTLIHEDAEYTC